MGGDQELDSSAIQEQGPSEEIQRMASAYRAIQAAENVELPYSAEYYMYREALGFTDHLQPSISKLKGLLGSLEQYRIKGDKSVNEASAGEVLNDRPHENFSWFESLLDDCLERVNSALDAVKRDEDNTTKTESLTKHSIQPKANKAKVAPKKLPGWGQSGSGNHHPRAPKHKACQDKALRKPQDRYSIQVDNSDTPFVPRLENLKGLVSESLKETNSDEDHILRSVVGNAAHCADYPHPLQESLDGLVYHSRQFDLGEQIRPRSMEFTKFLFVDTESLLHSMCEDLSGAEEIAVDLEHHDFRSYLGLTCLIQISTRKTDYIVDPFPLWNQLGKALAPVFTNPEIVKVFHGAFNDIIWLQRDFSIYVVNMFDTGEACRVLETQQKSLAFLLEHYCKVETDKKFQLADWRIRPLSKEMMFYARMDTHYLLYIYDQLRQELFHQNKSVPEHRRLPLRENIPNNALGTVLERSRMVTLQRYDKPSTEKIVRRAMHSHQISDFNDVQKSVYESLLKWRVSAARANDDSPGYIASNLSLQKISARLPEGLQRLKSMLAPQEKYASAHADEILELVISATKGIEATSAVFAPLPSVPVRPLTTTASTIAETIEPKKMVPVKAMVKGTFGTVIAGKACTRSLPDGCNTTTSVLHFSEPKSDLGTSSGECSQPSLANKIATVEEVNASFCLPFYQTPGATSSNGIQLPGGDKELKKTSGPEVRAAMDQMKNENSDKSEPLKDSSKRSERAGHKAWNEELGDFLPVSVKQAYKNTKSDVRMTGIQSIEHVHEEMGASSKIDSVWKEVGLFHRKDLVAAELRDPFQKGTSSSTVPRQSNRKDIGPGMVVPFQYSKAQQTKKKAKEQGKQGSENPAPFVQGDGFKKAKKRRLHPKSGNRSVKFVKKTA